MCHKMTFEQMADKTKNSQNFRNECFSLTPPVQHNIGTIFMISMNYNDVTHSGNILAVTITNICIYGKKEHPWNFTNTRATHYFRT